MLVKDWMNTEVVTIEADDSMTRATKLMEQHGAEILAVMDKEGVLAGIVTSGDIKEFSPSKATSLDAYELRYLIAKIKVKSIMNKSPIVISHDLTIEEAAEVLVKEKLSGAPVVNQKGEIMGTLTLMDICRVLISLTGSSKRGVQFAFELVDRPGSIKEVTDVIRSYGGRIVSILSSHAKITPGYRNVYVRAYYLDRQKLPQLIGEIKGKFTLRYMVDHRTNKREIYME